MRAEPHEHFGMHETIIFKKNRPDPWLQQFMYIHWPHLFDPPRPPKMTGGG